MEDYVTTEKTRREAFGLFGKFFAASVATGIGFPELFDMNAEAAEKKQDKKAKDRRRAAGPENRLGKIEGYLKPPINETMNYSQIKSTIFSHIYRFVDYIEGYGIDINPNLAGKRFDVDKNLAFAIISQESIGNVVAESRKKARGLMQLMEDTALEVGLRVKGIIDDRFNPELSIKGGMRYLQKQLANNDGNILHALIAYNWGPANLEYLKNIGATKRPWRELKRHLPRETAEYVLGIYKDMECLKNPKKYGIVINKNQKSFSREILEKRRGEYKTTGRESLQTIAKYFKIPLENIWVLNPHIIDERYAIPPREGILIPYV